MRQTSLLDSFMKRQNKKLNNQQNKDQNEQKDKLSPPVNSLKPTSKRNKMRIDSDEQSQYSSVRNKIEDLNVKDQDYHYNPQSHQPKKNGNAKPIQAKQRKSHKSAKIETKIGQNDNEDTLSQFTDATPIWAQKQHCKDKNMRTPNHPQYDPSTLYIPDDAWPNFTPNMKQYWAIKSDNYDKVILFKMGKFYQMFYDDALIGNKYLQLKYMGTKMHAGFPEKCLDKYASQLVELGFKTIVVEQMQTVEQMQKRVKQEKKMGKISGKILNRQITQVLTKGTYIPKEQNDKVYMPNYLLSLRVHDEVYAFCILQIGTNQISMGSVDSLDKFKTVLYQTRPVELIYDPDNVSFQLCRIMQKTFLQMQMSKLINKNNIWHPLNAQGELSKLQSENILKKPKIFQIIDTLPDLTKKLLYSTLSGLFDYLKKVFKFQHVIGSARFTFYQKDSHSKNMILDSQALQHLEIFQNFQGQKGSLFSIFDRTKTKFGKRLLRKWLMSPLMNQYHIEQRLNAIEDLSKIQLERNKVCSMLKKLPDMQKRINKLYHYAIKTTSQSKAIYFEDLNTGRLKQFKDTMEKMQQAWEAIMNLSDHKKNFKSFRLKQLVTLGNSVKINQEDIYEEDEDDQSTYEGLMPDVLSNLQQFKSYIKWQGDIPIPQKGLVAHFDQLQQEIEGIKKQLQQIIDKIRYQMNQPNLKFAHTKQRYEIQIPQKSDKRKPANFQFSSKRNGFSRYICPEIKKVVKVLEKTEQQIKQQMTLFVGFFFEQFKKKQKIWHRFVQIIAQIDCLISVTEYSMSGNKTRPKFTPKQFRIKGARHPCLSHIQFIPNDIVMDKKVMLLTGPNMGGKSTILRTACCLAILAQVGCYVPAEDYNCEVIDRIFTRIGASDKLELGKSTFFIEMEETKSVIEHGSSRSLAIMDELGRGTSTFDGLALAYSVLRNIAEDVRCYCMFATHYHMLLDQFRNKQEVSLMMMNCFVKNEEVIFLYKLVPGSVQRSFGLGLAKKIGICKQTIEVAEKQAEKMNNYIESRKKNALKKVIEFLNNS